MSSNRGDIVRRPATVRLTVPSPLPRPVRRLVVAARIVRVSIPLLGLVLPAVASAQDTLNFKTPDGWEVGNVEQTSDQLFLELVEDGEKVDNWTKLITVQQFRRGSGSPSPREFYEQIKARREERCPGLSEWLILEEDSETALYEWKMTGVCGGHPPQSELARLIFAQGTGYRVAFTTRGELTTEMRATWIEWLPAARFER